MEKTAEPLPSHSNLVGEGGKEPTAKTPHHRRGHEKTRRPCAGNFYHAALYDLLQSPPPHEDKIAAINHIKAKIFRLYAARLRHGNIELQDTDALQTERTTLYQLIRRWRRRIQCIITSVHNPACGMPTTTTKGIVNVFSTSLRLKYSPLRVTDESIGKMEQAGFSACRRNGETPSTVL